MKKKLIVVFFIIVIIIAVYSVVGYFMSFRKININIQHAGVTVTIYDSSGQPVKGLSHSGQVSLRAGDYKITPGGANISTQPIDLQVDSNTKQISVDPGYSSTYLATLASSESPAIKSVINSSYPSVVSDFTIENVAVYGYGDWATALLPQNSPGRGAQADTYETVLQKVNGVWKIAAAPSIVLSAKDYPNIPWPILDGLNSQVWVATS